MCMCTKSSITHYDRRSSNVPLTRHSETFNVEYKIQLFLREYQSSQFHNASNSNCIPLQWKAFFCVLHEQNKNSCVASHRNHPVSSCIISWFFNLQIECSRLVGKKSWKPCCSISVPYIDAGLTFNSQVPF